MVYSKGSSGRRFTQDSVKRIQAMRKKNTKRAAPRSSRINQAEQPLEEHDEPMTIEGELFATTETEEPEPEEKEEELQQETAQLPAVSERSRVGRIRSYYSQNEGLIDRDLGDRVAFLASSAVQLPSDPEYYAEPRIMEITPCIAAALVQRRAPQQRPLNRRHFLFLSRQMKAGLWIYNGDPIRLNQKCELLDGQHRCYAAIDADKSFKAPVVVVSDKAFQSVDTGQRVRTNGDVFRLQGEKYYNRLAAALMMICDLEEGRPIYGTAAASRRSPSELQEVCDRHPGIRNSVEFIGHRSAIPLRPNAVWPVMHYLMSQLDKHAADTFFNDLFVGAGLTRSDPVFHLRERLLANTLGRTKANRRDYVAWFTNAWNYRRQGRPMNVLRGATADKDPELE